MATRQQEILAAMMPVFDAFPHLPAWRDDGSPNAYLIAFDAIPAEYAIRAGMAAIRGTLAKCDNPAYPKLAELAVEARRLWSADLDDRRWRITAQAQLASQPAVVSAADMAKRKAAVDRLMSRLNLGAINDSKRPSEISRADAMEALRQAAELARASGPIPVSDELAAKLRGSRE